VLGSKDFNRGVIQGVVVDKITTPGKNPKAFRQHNSGGSFQSRRVFLAGGVIGDDPD
jgi:hypothetical protein